MASQTIVILGAGIGGLTVANQLRTRLDGTHRVVLIEQRAGHVFAPSLPWVVVGSRKPKRVTKDVRHMVKPGVEVMISEVQDIDPERKTVVASGNHIAFDYLIVALGADLVPGTLPGFRETRHIYDLSGAAAFADELRTFDGGRIAVVVTSLPFKCPAAPYEIALLIDAHLRKRRLRGKTEITIVTPESQPMPVAGPAIGEAVTALLEERGLQYVPNQTVAGIEDRTLVFANGSRETFDLAAAVPPHRPPAAVASSSLAGPNGWISVDSRSLRTGFDEVYAIGDVTTIALANGKPLPKAGVFAHAQALSVANSIAAELGVGRRSSFDGSGYCWIELGSGKAAFASGDFYADPSPVIALHQTGRMWHVGKLLFERYWMGNRIERGVAKGGLTLGSKLLRVPASL